MIIELGVFYVWPLYVLVVINWNIAVLFGISATVSFIRHYINIKAIVEEKGVRGIPFFLGGCVLVLTKKVFCLTLSFLQF